jgi:hypothetical protein
MRAAANKRAGGDGGIPPVESAETAVRVQIVKDAKAIK